MPHQGVNLLFLISGIVLSLSIKPLRDLVGTILTRCPGAMVLFVVGAANYQVDQQANAFIVAMAGGFVIILLSLPELFPRLALSAGNATLTTVFRSPQLKLGVTIGAIIIYLGFFAYPRVPEWVAYWRDNSDNSQDLAVLALPAYYSGGNRSQNEKLEFQWQLFSATHSLLHQILEPLGDEVRLEPRLGDRKEFQIFSERFSVPEGNVYKIRKELEEQGSANCEKARLLLHAQYDEHNHSGKAGIRDGEILYTFLECKSSNVDQRSPRLSQVHDGLFRSLIHGEKFDIFALKASVPIIYHLIRTLDLSDQEAADEVWKQVTQSFQQRYNDFEVKSLESNTNWLGHELGKENGCSNFSVLRCAFSWKDAYEEIDRYKVEQVEVASIPERSVIRLLEKTVESR